MGALEGLDGEVEHLAAGPAHVYATLGSELVTLSTPTDGSLREVHRLTLPARPECLERYEDQLLICLGEEGLALADLGDPAEPAISVVHDRPANPAVEFGFQGLVRRNNTLFAANSHGHPQLIAFDLSEQGRVAWAHGYMLGTPAWDVAAAGDRLLLNISQGVLNETRRREPWPPLSVQT